MRADYLVAEADESDASFLQLQPMMAVVTNIDADHMETYGGDVARLQARFVEFLHHLPFYGLAVVCIDDPGVNAVLPVIARPLMTYAIDAHADVVASDIVYSESGSRFRVSRGPDTAPLQIELRLPGRHNVLNALAAIAIAAELDVADRAIVKAFADFQGIDRRFQIYGERKTKRGRVLFVDDYGHHPTEIAATVAAARSGWPGRRLMLVFQPHRYTRTRDLLDDFAHVLSSVDALVLLEVYAAGEEPIAGADTRAIARAVRSRGSVEPVFAESLSELPALLESILEDGDLILTMGAGDIGAAAATLADSFSPAELKSVK